MNLSEYVQAIDEFMRLLKLTSKSSTVHGALKLVPLWVVRLALATGVVGMFTNLFKVVNGVLCTTFFHSSANPFEFLVYF